MKHKKGDLSWLKISAFVTHQVQQGCYTLVMPVRHCLTTSMHVIMAVLFIIRIEDTDRKRHVEDGERSQLDNFALVGN